jgi:hypothetical protein
MVALQRQLEYTFLCYIPLFLLVAITAADGNIRKEHFSSKVDAAVHTEAYLPLLKSSASIRDYCCL